MAGKKSEKHNPIAYEVTFENGVPVISEIAHHLLIDRGVREELISASLEIISAYMVKRNLKSISC